MITLGNYQIDTRKNKVINRVTKECKKLHCKKIQKELAKILIDQYGRG